jgi:hypothetical protein
MLVFKKSNRSCALITIQESHKINANILLPGRAPVVPHERPATPFRDVVLWRAGLVDIAGQSAFDN